MYILNKAGIQKLKGILEDRGLTDHLDLNHCVMELEDHYDQDTGESYIELGKVERKHYHCNAYNVESFSFCAEDFDLIEGF